VNIIEKVKDKLKNYAVEKAVFESAPAGADIKLIKK
jgi:hypothetical protein